MMVFLRYHEYVLFLVLKLYAFFFLFVLFDFTHINVQTLSHKNCVSMKKTGYCF